MEISSLPVPQVLEELDYEAILAENEAQVKTLLPQWIPHDSDDISVVLQAVSYKELLLRARLNERFKSMLLPYMTGADLDLFATGYGVERLKGSYPTALFEFSLSSLRPADFTIPKGYQLTAGDGIYRSRLMADLVIPAGEISGSATAELLFYADEVVYTTDLMVNPLPFLEKIKQLDIFTGGGAEEKDSELRERVILAMGRFSTAGSRASYLYHIYSADERVEDAAVLSPTPGAVEVYLAGETVDEVMLERVRTAITDEKVRPITDDVQVQPAEIIQLEIRATIYLFDLAYTGQVDNHLKGVDLLWRRRKIGESLPLSELIKTMMISGVYDVRIETPLADVICGVDQVIRVMSVELNYQKKP